MTSEAMTAEAITAPIGEITLGCVTYALRFDNEQIRQTELCWQYLTGSVMGYLGILHQADAGVFAALCALIYGAILSGQADAGVKKTERMTILRFDRIADYFAVKDAGKGIVKAAMDALPKGGGEKNA